MRKHAVKLHTAAVANGDGAEDVAAENYEDFTVFIESSNGGGGGVEADVVIKSKAPSGNWVAIDTRSLAAAGDTVVSFSGAHQEIRVSIENYVDGSFDIGLNARGDR